MIPVPTTPASFENDCCSICLEPFSPPLDGHIATGNDPSIKVNHVFHSHCIYNWLNEHSSCPFCYKTLVLKNGQIENGIRSPHWLLQKCTNVGKELILQINEFVTEFFVAQMAKELSEGLNERQSDELLRGGIAIVTTAAAAGIGACVRKGLAKLLQREEPAKSVIFFSVLAGAYVCGDLEADIVVSCATTAAFFFASERFIRHPIKQQMQMGVCGSMIAIGSMAVFNALGMFESSKLVHSIAGTSIGALSTLMKGNEIVKNTKRFLGIRIR